MRVLVFFITSLILTFLPTCCVAGDFIPTVYVYSGDMPGFGEELVELLDGSIEGFEFVAIGDPTLLSSLMPMPDTACIVLAVMKGKEVETLITPLITYFMEGGALLGFQGCLSLNTVGELARVGFPVFGNATGPFTVKGGVPVNEYVRGEDVPGFADLPDQFDLLGQFYAYSANSSKDPVDPRPATGSKRVVYRDESTGAPMIVSYENDAGSRSISLAGFFVRPTETARNYYGKLLGDPLFKDLMVDCISWTLDGATRAKRFATTYEDMIADERERRQGLIQTAERNKSDLQRRRMLLLAIAWAVGVVSMVGLVYLGFFRNSG